MIRTSLPMGDVKRDKDTAVGARRGWLIIKQTSGSLVAAGLFFVRVGKVNALNVCCDRKKTLGLATLSQGLLTFNA